MLRYIIEYFIKDNPPDKSAVCLVYMQFSYGIPISMIDCPFDIRRVVMFGVLHKIIRRVRSYIVVSESHR
jgi:hypothetical protein